MRVRDDDFKKAARALEAWSEGQAARASMRISEQTQALLDAVWDQLTNI